MPDVYEIQAPNGQTLEIESDHPPTKEEAERVFAAAGVGEQSWAQKHPKMATAAKVAADTLPAIGGMVGGVLAAPETLGMGSLLGASLGVGAGKGLRDLVTEGAGLEPVTSPTSKAIRIAGDTLVAGVTPGAMTAAMTPLRTASELADTVLPDRIRGLLPSIRVPAKLPAAEFPETPGNMLPSSEPSIAVRMAGKAPVLEDELVAALEQAKAGEPAGKVTLAPSHGSEMTASGRDDMIGQKPKGKQVVRYTTGQPSIPVPEPTQAPIQPVPSHQVAAPSDADLVAGELRGSKRRVEDLIPATKSKRGQMSNTPGLTVNDVDALGQGFNQPGIRIKGLTRDAAALILRARASRAGLYRSEAELNAIVDAQLANEGF